MILEQIYDKTLYLATLPRPIMGASLWRFDVNEFRAAELPIDNNNTRLHMCNLRREGDC